ncbi:MAG: LLM class flavin-dependent oxidoreductase [Novosphingobium sp.]
MRAPDFGALYAAALEMCAYADKIGVDAVVLPEHHGLEDGYNPVPSLMAAAVAARTERIAFLVSRGSRARAGPVPSAGPARMPAQPMPSSATVLRS